MSDTIFLIIFVILSCCCSVIPLVRDDDTTKTAVVCIEGIMFIIVYSFVIISMNNWADGRIKCGDQQGMKVATFVLFLLWFLQYTMYLLIIVCGCVMNYCFEESFITKLLR